MLRPAAALASSWILLAPLLVGAGDSGSATPSSSGARATSASSARAGDSLESLWRAAKQNVAVVSGTSDYQPGRNRVSFLVVDRQSRLVTTPTATVWVATGLKATPYAQTVARSERIGIPGGSTAEAGAIFVARVNLPKPGTYWFLASPNGGSGSVRALGNLVVHARSEAPGIGQHALASRTPTLADVHGDAAKLTTRVPPDRSLLRTSVAQALAAHEPFVVAFATPKFCTSRTCGPVVDVVETVAKRLAGTGVRFIHVEIYRDNDPAKGTNRWVKQWNLPSEPFTFLVDRRGIVRAKLEGAFSTGELERDVRQYLVK